LVDPLDCERAYIWPTLPTGSRTPTQGNLLIWDISDVASAEPRLLAQGNWNDQYEVGTFDGRLAFSTRRPGPIPICSATYSCLRR
jgi:hypothetical protein